MKASAVTLLLLTLASAYYIEVPQNLPQEQKCVGCQAVVRETLKLLKGTSEAAVNAVLDELCHGEKYRGYDYSVKDIQDVCTTFILDFPDEMAEAFRKSKKRDAEKWFCYEVTKSCVEDAGADSPQEL